MRSTERSGSILAPLSPCDSTHASSCLDNSACGSLEQESRQNRGLDAFDSAIRVFDGASHLLDAEVLIPSGLGEWNIERDDALVSCDCLVCVLPGFKISGGLENKIAV